MLTYDLTKTDGPLYKCLYECIKNDISQGKLSSGEKMPSKRTLAKNLGISTITVENIQKVVAEQYNISVSDIKSKKRDKKYVIPRQIALYIARELTEYSFPELGNEFGGRDHTTAMHSYEKIQNLLKTDSSLNSTVQMLMRNVKDYKK